VITSVKGSPKCTLSTCCWTIELWYSLRRHKLKL